MKLGAVDRIEQAKSCVDISVNGGEGGKVHLRLTSPLRNVWRLQSVHADATLVSKGAIQVLAEISQAGERASSSSLPLNVNQNSCSSMISSPDSPSKVEMLFSPFRLSFLDGRDDLRFEIAEISVSGDTSNVTCPLDPEERIYGTGERFNGANQMGKKVAIWAEGRWCQTEGNSYIPIPLILSTRKYGILLNRFESSLFDIGKTESASLIITQHDAPLDMYILLEDDPRGCFARLCSIWGFPVMPPEWGFGVLVSRHEKLREFGAVDGIREMMAKMDEHDLPWSAVIIEGWDMYDSASYDDLRTIVKELHEKGKKVMVYHACGRMPEQYWQKQAAIPEYFVRDSDGNCTIEEAPHFNPEDAPDRRRSSFLDITNPQALDWWQNCVWGRLLGDIGIEGAKIDFCEQFPEDSRIVLSSGQSVKGMHQYYPVKYNIMMYNLFQKMCADGGLCWSRGGGIGTHHYPFVWCGDQRREFQGLRAILSALLSSGLSGIPFMGHDLGGYIPAGNGDNEAEVFVRGTQLSCFSATMQTHGTVTRPYDFPREIVDIYRAYSRVRSILIPYLLEQAGICCATGMPLVRHLFLLYPDDKRCWDCEDEYFFGEDILVAPVLDDTRARDIFLPSGKWIHLFDGDEYDGPQEIDDFPAPLEKIPVFVAAEPTSDVLPSLVEKIRNEFTVQK